MILLKDALMAIADWLEAKELDKVEASKPVEDFTPRLMGFYGQYSDTAPVSSYVSQTSNKFTQAQHILEGYLAEQMQGQLNDLIAQMQEQQPSHQHRGHRHPLYPEKG